MHTINVSVVQGHSYEKIYHTQQDLWKRDLFDKFSKIEFSSHSSATRIALNSEELITMYG